HHRRAPRGPVGVEFARRMAPMFMLPAQTAAQLLTTPGQPTQVLDVAAGHGLFGIQIGLHNPSAEITFLDWENVLEVARDNAIAHGLSGRFRMIAGNAFDVAFGSGYD